MSISSSISRGYNRMAIASSDLKRRVVVITRANRSLAASTLVFCLSLAWLCIYIMGVSISGTNFSNVPINHDHDGWDGQVGPIVTIEPGTPSLPLRLVTYNVRYDNSKPVGDERPWKIRGPRLVNQMQFISSGHDNSFFCLQEALHHQVKDIEDRLGDRWAYIGRGRGYKETDEEYSPIFYRADVWECTQNKTKWLSPTPDVPSKGWDAALPRIVTIAEFTHVETKAKVVVMATHFDHQGAKARKHSAEILIDLAEEWSTTPGISAVLIGGDFNSDAADGAYQLMTGEDSNMSDMSHLLPAKEHYGNHLTYTSFGEGYDASRIDFLFVHEPRKVEILTYGVLSNIFDDKIRISDHRPVVADMLVPY